MKKAFLLCIAISVGFVLGGCADLNHSATTTSGEKLPPGTSPGLSGGGGGGGGGNVPIKNQL